MKKFRFLGLVLCLCLLMSMAAYADIAIEPRDNFYEKHRDECSYENSTYITNGSQGWVEIYSSPKGDVKTLIPNGRSFLVSWVWNSQWGCIEYDPDTLTSSYGESGWVRLEDMLKEYDSESFRADYAAGISQEEFTLSILTGQEVYGYKYPGSGIVTAVLSNFTSDESVDVGGYEIYTDGQGGRWGYVNYYFGMRDFWINLDTPLQQLGPGAEYTQPELIPAATDELMSTQLKQARGLEPYVFAAAGGCVLIAVALAAWLIIKRRKQAD